MGEFEELRWGDRDVVFRDWGADVVLRVLTQEYDAQEMMATTVAEDREVVGLIQELPVEPSKGTGGGFLKRGLLVQVKREDLPTEELRMTQRVVYGEREYEVTRGETSADGGVVLLECREM